MLWRVATDCDKAKLEVAKAGAVAPAVALLKAACQDFTVSPAATEVHMLLISFVHVQFLHLYVYAWVCARDYVDIYVHVWSLHLREMSTQETLVWLLVLRHAQHFVAFRTMYAYEKALLCLKILCHNSSGLIEYHAYW